MIDQERVFISFVEEAHPLLQEMPVPFQGIWFNHYQSSDKEYNLFLQMERIFKNPQSQKGDFLDVLTFEITDIDALLEWEEDFPNKDFVAADPYCIFYDGINEQKQGLFSVGDLDLKTMQFIPELEIYITIEKEGLRIDFQDGTEPSLWKKYIVK